MTPSWYDVLGVDEDATSDEIRAAWQEAVAGLDPTDRRFKQRNRAAEVLLDPARRAAHDRDLAAQSADEDDADDADDAGAADFADGGGVPERSTTAPVKLDKPVRRSGTRTPASAGSSAAVVDVGRDDSDDSDDDDEDARAGSGPSRRALTVVLGLVALVLVVLTVVSLLNGGGSEQTASDDAGLPDAREVQAARKAAETAIGPVLSYDYRDLDKSKAAATSFMTTEYTGVYEQNFEGFIEENAPTTKTIVTAEVVDSGIVRTGENRVDVLLFVNRPTRNASGDSVSRDQVTVQMLDVDGRWLVDCLVTSPGDSCGD